MSEPGRNWNHPHWDHGVPATVPVREPRHTPWLYALLDRAHLPHHPAAPLALVVLGVVHCYLVVRTFASIAGGDRALLVGASIIALLALAPGAGLIATGAWDLARGPLRFRLGRSRLRGTPRC